MSKNRTGYIIRLLVLLVILIFLRFEYGKRQKEIQESFLRLIGREVYAESRTNKLKLGPDDTIKTKKEITLNGLREFDFMTKQELYALRKKLVQQNAELVQGKYIPSENVFGAIADGKPWWGMEGQWCYDSGNRSIEGLSEESRFFLNPFLLLAIDGWWGVKKSGHCFVSYPRVVSLIWYASEKKAVATYDISRFKRERKYSHICDKCRNDKNIYLELINYNARDFGYNYVYAVPKLSKEVIPQQKSRLFEDACQLRSFIHLGSSCGYPGGCNNASPYEPDMLFMVKKIPAEIYCKLWKEKPANKEQQADFVFVIEFK